MEVDTPVPAAATIPASLQSEIDAAVALAPPPPSDPTAAVDALLALERTHRLAASAPETAAVCVALVKMLVGRGEWRRVMDAVVVVAKRRAQLKQVLVEVVREVMGVLGEVEDGLRMEMVQTLIDVCAGKIYVELERARLTRTLAEAKEKAGDVAGAAEIMQDLQVETYGSMERREKFDFILEQIRLCLDKKDYIRAGIVSKKISAKSLAMEELSDLRLRYYKLMIRIYAQQKKYLEICRAYLARFETKSVQENDSPAEGGWPHELQLAIAFLLVSPREPTQADLLLRIANDKKTLSLSPLSDFLKLFKTLELIRWPVLAELYLPALRTILGSLATLPEIVDIQAAAAKSCPEGEDVWSLALRERVAEHNLRVVSTYFTRIRLGRLAELLGMTEAEAEKKLTEEVSDSKALWAKIDRPAGIVLFAKPLEPSQVLNEWTGSVGSLLDMVDKTCHLVNKEVMVHQAAKGQ